MKSIFYVTIKLDLEHSEPKTVTELNECLNEMDYGFISTTQGIEVKEMEMTDVTLISNNEES